MLSEELCYLFTYKQIADYFECLFLSYASIYFKEDFEAGLEFTVYHELASNELCAKNVLELLILLRPSLEY